MAEYNAILTQIFQNIKTLNHKVDELKNKEPLLRGNTWSGGGGKKRKSLKNPPSGNMLRVKWIGAAERCWVDRSCGWNLWVRPSSSGGKLMSFYWRRIWSFMHSTDTSWVAGVQAFNTHGLWAQSFSLWLGGITSSRKAEGSQFSWSFHSILDCSFAKEWYQLVLLVLVISAMQI